MLKQTLGRIRRNHGLEHATIHVLTEQYRQFSAQGHSDHRGFALNIYGNISDQQVAAAVQEARDRLHRGERQLALHPNCGTTLITTAVLSTLAAELVFGVESRRAPGPAGRLTTMINAGPLAVLMVVLAIILSKPIGMGLQSRYTTDGNIGDMQVVSVKRVEPSVVTRLFHLLLAGGQKSYPPNAYLIETRG